MTLHTYSSAIDALYGHFLDNWNDSEASALLGYDAQILWANLEPNKKPDSSKTWLRVSQQTVLEHQSTLSNDVGEAGKRRFTTTGLIFVQFFFPKSEPRSWQVGRNLAEIARNIFRHSLTNNSIWFRRAKINELPEERDTFRLNVVAEYEYDELG